MRIAINISEETYNEVCWRGLSLCPRGREELVKAIKKGTPLDQEPRKGQEPTGHWILANSQDNVDVENGNNRYICSKCTFSDIHAKSSKVPYCWHCGARMESDI